MALPIDSDWPYFFLNSLSPDAGAATPQNPLVDQDLGLAVDPADLQRSLDAWTHISFNFDNDDLVVPASSSPGDKDEASKAAPIGPAGEAKDQSEREKKEGGRKGRAADTGDSSPYNPRRGVGTAVGPMNQLFPGPQEHAFRLSHQHNPYYPLPTTSGAPSSSAPHHLHPHQFHGQIVQPQQLSLSPTSPNTPNPSSTVAPSDALLAFPPSPQHATSFTAPPISFSQLLQSPDGLASFLAAQAQAQDPRSHAASQQQAADNAAAAAAFEGTGVPVLRPFTTPAGRTVASLSELLGDADAMVAAAAAAGEAEAPPAAAAATTKRGAATRRASTAKDASAASKPNEAASDSSTPAAAAPLDVGTVGDAGEDLEDDEANKRAVEEDKRRRNTAASARFRIKKKLREQAVERTAQELRERVNELEKEVEGLKKENGWLRGLIVDRAARDAGADTEPAPTTGGGANGRAAKRRRQDAD